MQIELTRKPCPERVENAFRANYIPQRELLFNPRIGDAAWFGCQLKTWDHGRCLP